MLQHTIAARGTLMTGNHIIDIESAINHWREQTPSPDGITLSPEVRALADGLFPA